MINCEYFDALNESLKEIRKCRKPFGGIQIVLSGDFFQLPPIERNPKYWGANEKGLQMKREESLFQKIHYGNSLDASIHFGSYNKVPDNRRYLFDSRAWKELINYGMKIYELKKGFRQTESKFIALLDDLRYGIHCPEMWSYLRPYYHKKFDDDSNIKPTYLSAYRNRADSYNQVELSKLSGECVPFHSIEYVQLVNSNEWPEPEPAKVKHAFQSIISQEMLFLKIGAQVILISNINVGEGLANGSRGVVVGFSKQKDELSGQMLRLPIVRFLSGKTFIVGYHEFRSYVGIENLNIIRRQIPLKLGWGLTIHKSQGMTLDRAVVYLEKSFVPGHAYVAMSRIKNVEGLSLQKFGSESIWASERVKEFYCK
jgi:ATP-dependent DNA helicase PIF1